MVKMVEVRCSACKNIFSFIGWIMLQRGKTVERTIEAVPYIPIFKTREDAMDTDWCHGRSAVKVRVTIMEQP